jgi:Zn-dependent metalloprotease
MIEQWHQGVTVEEADWLLGQTMFPVAFRGVGLRSLKNPGSAYKKHEVLRDDIQPKHMDHLYTGDSDRQGVHINSGIPNHAFYLAAMKIGGNSWEKVGQVWYRTLLEPRDKIPVKCSFKQFAEVTVEVAKKLFPQNVLVGKAILDAWLEVGVLN